MMALFSRTFKFKASLVWNGPGRAWVVKGLTELASVLVATVVVVLLAWAGVVCVRTVGLVSMEGMCLALRSETADCKSEAVVAVIPEASKEFKALAAADAGRRLSVSGNMVVMDRDDAQALAKLADEAVRSEGMDLFARERAGLQAKPGSLTVIRRAGEIRAAMDAGEVFKARPIQALGPMFFIYPSGMGERERASYGSGHFMGLSMLVGGVMTLILGFVLVRLSDLWSVWRNAGRSHPLAKPLAEADEIDKGMPSASVWKAGPPPSL